MSDCSRRQLVGLLCLAACRPHLGAETDAETDPASPEDADLPPVGSDGWRFASFSAFPALSDVDGSAELHLPDALLDVIVVRTSQTTAAAVWAICSHGACAVAWDVDRLVCPCHGSEFDLDGAVLDGPAPRPLAVFPAVVADDGVWIWRPL